MVQKEVVDMIKSSYKIFGLLVVIVSVILVSYSTYVHIERSDKIPLVVDILPTDAQLTIDGNLIKRGTLYLSPGVYKFKAFREGFTEYSNTVHVNEYTKKYAIFMEADSREGEQWIEKHKEDYVRVRKINDEAVKEAGEIFSRNNPIASKLPYRALMYTVGYRLDKSDPSENSIIIEIDAPEGYRQSALYQIRQLGYDPTDFNINFRYYENPFPL